MLDVFKNNPFGVISLTASSNEMPYLPSRIRQMGLFQSEGISTLSVAIESLKGTLKLVPTSTRGGPGHQSTPDKRVMRDFRAVHLQVDDALNADEIQGVREFGTENQLQTIKGVVDRRFAKLFGDIDTTIENLRMGALKGQVLDADGVTVLWDLFSEFNVTALGALDFTLGTAATNIKSLCNQVVRAFTDELGATPMGQVHAFCGDSFYDKLSTHAEVRDSYHRQQDSAFLRSGSLAYEMFTYGNITWENYRGSVAGTPFVATGDCRFFITGVPGLFIDRYAPADYKETVNTIGLPRYAKLIEKPDGKGYDMQAQSNPITLCTRPRTLRRGFTSN